MINIFRNIKKRQRGAATIIVTTVLIVLISMIMIFAAGYNKMQQNTAANLNRNNQAFQAAEAGMEFAINYLRQNSAAILANPSGGYIQPYSNSSTTNVTLANNSKYSFVYSNPVANNYNLIQITSTGTSDDGGSTRVITQQVQHGSLLASLPDFSLISQGAVEVEGSSKVTNLEQAQTVQSGGAVNFQGSGKVVTQTGSYNNGFSTQSNIASLKAMSSNNLFATYFGASPNAVKNSFTNYYSNNSSTNYSSTLNGKTGTSIWIDQTGGTASIRSNTTIGSPTSPVILVINGNFDISGNVTIYGMVFVFGSGLTETDITGNVNITGGVVSGSSLELSGSTGLTYNSAVLNALQGQAGTSYYAKIPGTWKDF